MATGRGGDWKVDGRQMEQWRTRKKDRSGASELQLSCFVPAFLRSRLRKTWLQNQHGNPRIWAASYLPERQEDSLASGQTFDENINPETAWLCCPKLLDFWKDEHMTWLDSERPITSQQLDVKPAKTMSNRNSDNPMYFRWIPPLCKNSKENARNEHVHPFAFHPKFSQ